MMRLHEIVTMLREGKSVSSVFLWAAGHDPEKTMKRLERMMPLEKEMKVLSHADGKEEIMTIIRRKP